VDRFLKSAEMTGEVVTGVSKKERRTESGRRAEQNRKRGEGRFETFDFPASRGSAGGLEQLKVRRKTIRKRMRENPHRNRRGEIA
jgi:hypothetical protein